MQRWFIKDKATPASFHRKGLDNDPLIHNYVQNGVICASSSVEHRRCRHRQRHGGIRNTGKVLNCGEGGSKMSGKIKSGGRRGKYSRSESSLPFCFRLETLANVVHATVGEGENTSQDAHTHVFLVARRVAQSQLFRMSSSVCRRLCFTSTRISSAAFCSSLVLADASILRADVLWSHRPIFIAGNSFPFTMISDSLVELSSL